MTASFFERSRIVARPGWSRWLVPPAALSIHLAIGAVYAWSVFKDPLQTSMGISGKASAMPFTIAIVVLGVSAALFGTRVDRKGPRWGMAVATAFFCSGRLIAALGVYTGQFWLVVFGYGVVGGIGAGVGYISTVPTMMAWFPDRPGLATGIAIMGFGGGALIASPLANDMFDAFGRDATGVSMTFLGFGCIWAVFMSVGWLLIRVPPPGWSPAGWAPEASKAGSVITTASVSAANALKTPQFWLLWVVLCLNITAGIGILEDASPMFAGFFHDASGAEATAAAAVGFVAILSLASVAGRLGWSALSDVVGRKNIFRLYLGGGALLYLMLTLITNSDKVLFLVYTMLIMSFNGAGFATIPAYLRDVFGPAEVGAIYGRLLTAWSVAGVLGPFITNSIADSQEQAGKSGPDLYIPSFSIMIVLLVVGFVCNELVRRVNRRYHEPALVPDEVVGRN